jgi:hypothetical protein
MYDALVQNLYKPIRQDKQVVYKAFFFCFFVKQLKYMEKPLPPERSQGQEQSLNARGLGWWWLGLGLQSKIL